MLKSTPQDVEAWVLAMYLMEQQLLYAYLYVCVHVYIQSIQ